jgi:DNA-3-methyladenine glycosylase
VSRSLPRSFYARPSVVVAPYLLNKVLVAGPCRGRIVEVEAYAGGLDPASHAYRGPTARNATMFGPPGHLYVYLVYGIHHCANIVCGPGSKPEAVLLRAAEIIDGEALARRARGSVAAARLAAGPGNLAAAFGINRALNGADLTRGPLWLAGSEPSMSDTTARIVRLPRIGVDYAGPWTTRPLRFLIADDPHRSRG